MAAHQIIRRHFICSTSRECAVLDRHIVIVLDALLIVKVNGVLIEADLSRWVEGCGRGGTHKHQAIRGDIAAHIGRHVLGTRMPTGIRKAGDNAPCCGY